MTFRDQLQKDLLTMMNQAVFGLTVSVDGVDLLCAEQADHGTPFKERGADSALGIMTDTRTLIFRATEMPVPPVIGQQVALDGEYWFVSDVLRPIGHFVIQFSREAS